jgi:hypothetical protein
MKSIVVALLIALAPIAVPGTAAAASEEQNYVDHSLMQGGHLTGAAVLRLNGTVDGSRNLAVSAAEAKAVIAQYAVPQAKVPLVIGGVSSMIISVAGKSMYARRVGGGGVVCVKTKTYVLIGVYDSKAQPGRANAVVEQLADFLISQNK